MPAEKFNALDTFTRLAASFRLAPDGAHRRVWSELGPWFRSLVTSAGPKWVPRMAMNFPCHVVDTVPRPRACSNAAVASCYACHRPTCLGHSFVNVEGEVICYSCVSKMARDGARRPEPSNGDAERKERLARAREILGVGPRAKWEAIHRAYRKKAAAAHPDRGGHDEDFREIQAAYELLKEELSGKVA